MNIYSNINNSLILQWHVQFDNIFIFKFFPLHSQPYKCNPLISCKIVAPDYRLIVTIVVMMMMMMMMTVLMIVMHLLLETKNPENNSLCGNDLEAFVKMPKCPIDKVKKLKICPTVLS